MLAASINNPQFTLSDAKLGLTLSCHIVTLLLERLTMKLLVPIEQLLPVTKQGTHFSKVTAPKNL